MAESSHGSEGGGPHRNGDKAGSIYCLLKKNARIYVCIYIYIDIPHDAVHHGWVMLGWFWPAKQLEDLQVQKPLFRRSLQVQTFLVHQYQWGGLRDNCSTPVFLHFKLRFQFKISLGFCDRICKLQNDFSLDSP